MLIYEPQGFSLTILSFTETESGGEKDREKGREKRKARERNRQHDAKLMDTDRTGEMQGGRNRDGKLRGVMLQLL